MPVPAVCGAVVAGGVTTGATTGAMQAVPLSLGTKPAWQVIAEAGRAVGATNPRVVIASAATKEVSDRNRFIPTS